MNGKLCGACFRSELATSLELAAFRDTIIIKHSSIDALRDSLKMAISFA